MSKKLFYPLLSGFLLGIGFILPNLRFLCWIALVPLFFFLNSENSRKKVFGAGFLTGFFYFGQVLSWFFNTLPIDWTGIYNKFLGFGVLFLIWFVSVLFLSLFTGFFALSYKLLKKEGWLNLFLIPSLWVIFEYLRAAGFSLLVLGDASLFGPHWTWGNLGYLLSENQFLRSLTSFGGIYLLSFIIVFASSVFYFLLKEVLRKKKLRTKESLLVLLIFFLIFVSYQIKIKNSENSLPSLRVAVLQSDFPSSLWISSQEMDKRFEVKKYLIREAVKNSPDIIVFPEDSRFLAHIDMNFIKQNLQEKEMLVIDSSRTETSKGIRSIIGFFDTKKGMLNYQEKLFLAPMGEYLPYWLKLPALVIKKSWVKEFESSRGYKRGEKKEIISVDFLNTKIGGFLCSEIYSPNSWKKLSENAQILFNMGSHAFAHGSSILESQIESMAKTRAAENGRYLIRATNMGYSYIIDDKGDIVKKTEKKGNQVLFGEVFPKKEKTIYSRFGDWILILAFGIIVFSGIRKKYKYFTKKTA